MVPPYGRDVSLQVFRPEGTIRFPGETKALLREAALNRKPMSIETRLKCIVNVRPVTITELDGSNPQFFPTIVSAAEAIGCSVKTIQRALRSNGVIKRKYLITNTADT